MKTIENQIKAKARSFRHKKKCAMDLFCDLLCRAERICIQRVHPKHC